MRDSYGRAGDSITAGFGKIGPALLAGVSAAAITSAVRRIGSVVSEVARIGDAAATAGVSVEQFQELTYVSDQSRIGVDAMTDSLKELSLRADEFVVTGKGPAAEAFNRLGFTADQLKRKLQDPPKLLEEIADKAKDLDDAARIRIFDEILGGTGAEQLTRLLSGGGDALRRLRQEARDSGAVLDAEVIRKAEELDRKFAALTTRLSNFGKGLAVGLADATVKIATLRTDLEDLTTTIDRAESLLGEGTALELSTDQTALDENKEAIAQIISEYHRLSEAADQLTGPLLQAASQLAMMGEGDASGELNRVSLEMIELVGDLNDGGVSAEEFEQRIQELTNAAQTALAEVGAIDGVQFIGVTSALGSFVTMMGTAINRARELRAALPGANPEGVADLDRVDPDASDPRGDQTNPPRRVIPPNGPSKSLRPQLPGIDASFGIPDPVQAGGGAGGRGSGGNRTPRQNELEREIASIAEETNALRIEAEALAEVTGARAAQGDAIDFARAKAELLTAAQQAGVEVTPQLKAQIDELASEYVAAGGAAELAADKIQEVQDASQAGAQSVADTFQGLASGALTAKQAVGQLILEVLKLSLQKRLLGLAENGGFLGDVFGFIGGGFAEGGFTGNGGKHQPAGVVHKGEFVMSKKATSAIGVGNLSALHSAAKRGYAEGGLVGPASAASALTARSSGSSDASNPVTINAPVKVNASGGTSDQNADLAKQITKSMENSMKGVVVKELREQLRPGNMLNQARTR